ncbi:MAG: FtsX-like permease family protein [Thermoplasmata archaeon]|nr:FtsX-like permease family protein [Thermoplasmata archaeon]
MENPLLTVILLALVLIVIVYVRKTLYWKMAVRNFKRHRVNSLLASLGFVMGTVIITSSLIMGDTLGTMVESFLYDSFWEIDEVIDAHTPTGDRLLISQTEAQKLAGEIERLDHVEAVEMELWLDAAVVDLTSSQFEPQVNLRALPPSSFFAKFYSNGRAVTLPEDGVLMGEEVADALSAKEGDRLVIYTPRGNITLGVSFIIDTEGRGGQGGIFVSLQRLQSMLNLTDFVNVILVSNSGGVKGGIKYSGEIRDEIESIIKNYRHPSGYPYKITLDKGKSVEELKSAIESINQIFLVFGSFSIIAGTVLIANIFVMIGEERRVEMGIMRAMGMKRRDLARLYIAEGTFYGAIASIFGVILGILSSYVLMRLFRRVISTAGGNFNILKYFTTEPSSLLLGALGGFSISIISVYFISHRISNLEISSAIRNLPPPPISRKEKKAVVIGLFLLLMGGALTLLGVRVKQSWEVLLGVSLLIVGTAILSRRYVSDRKVFTAMGVALLLWWLLPYPSFETYERSILVFVFSGVFATLGGISIIIFNSDLLINGVERMAMLLKRSPAPVKIAISYPLRKPFRTSVTIFVFSLVTFTITMMSILNTVFLENREAIIEENSGGYEIIGECYLRPPPDLGDRIVRNHPEVKAVDSVLFGDVIYSIPIPQRGMRVEYPIKVFGVGENFTKRNRFYFADLQDGIDEKEAWRLVLKGGYTIVGGVGNTMGMTLASPGDTVTLKGITGEEVKLKVVGVLSTFVLRGFIVSKEMARVKFNITRENVFFMKLSESADVNELKRTLEKENLQYGMDVVIMESLVDRVLKVQTQMFDLFNVFLGLGLIVGVAGLGIVTNKAIYERRHEIGVMRAIGFRRRGVVNAFVIEQSFVTILGILLGIILGSAVGYLVWKDEMSQNYPNFALPWMRLCLIALITFSIALLSIIPTARGAARVPPAEALRYE